MGCRPMGLVFRGWWTRTVDDGIAPRMGGAFLFLSLWETNRVGLDPLFGSKGGGGFRWVQPKGKSTVE